MQNPLAYKKYMPWLLAIAYGIIYAIYTYPLLFNAANLFPGVINSYGDAPVILGNAHVFKEAIANDSSPFYTDSWFYPTGTTLLMHGHTMLLSILHWLSGTGDSFIVFNLTLLLFFVLSAIGMYRLVVMYTQQHLLAFVMGFMWAFSPYKMYQLQDHVWYVLTLSLPFYVIHFMQTFSFAGKRINLVSHRRLLYCSLWLLFTFLCDYYTLFFLLYFSAFYFVIQFFNLDRIRLLSFRTIIVFIISCAATTFLVKWLNKMQVPDNTASIFSGDMLGYLLPIEAVNYRPYLPKLESLTGYRIDDIRESYFFTGFAFLLLVIFSFTQFIKQKKQINYPVQLKVFLLLTAAFFCLSVPQIRIAGWYVGENPFGLFNYIPFLNNVRVSGRYFSMVSLFGLLSFAIIFSRFQLKYKNVYPVILFLLLFFEYFPGKYSFINRENNPEVLQILKAQNNGAVMNIPFGVRDGLSETGHVNTMDIYYQSVHNKKMLGGYISRLDKNIINYYRSDTVVRQLLDLQKSPELQLHVPEKHEVIKFYETFKPAYILISPEWRQSPAAKHFESSLQYFNYEVLWEKDYVLYKIQGIKK